MSTALKAIIIFTDFLVAITSFLSIIQYDNWSRPSFFMVRLVMKYKEKEEMVEGKGKNRRRKEGGRRRRK